MKKSFFKTIAVVAMGTVVAFTACTKSEHPGYEKTENGLFYKFYQQDDKGVKPKEGDMVRVSLKWYTAKDSLMFDSRDPKFNQRKTGYLELPLEKPTFKGSFEEALGMMSVGDSASFLISADSMFLKTFHAQELPPFIQKGSLLTFNVTLLKITSKDEVEKEMKKRMEEKKVMMEMRKNEEGKALEKFITDNKITAKPTEDGLYYIEKVKGKGPHPSKSDQVKVNYTLSFVDGKVLETTEEDVAKKAGIYDDRRPYEPAQFGVDQLIPGMTEGLLMMSKGAKARLIIPSSIGYGEGNQGIPPYTTLVFDVEMIDISAAPPQQQPMMQQH